VKCRVFMDSIALAYATRRGAISRIAPLSVAGGGAACCGRNLMSDRANFYPSNFMRPVSASRKMKPSTDRTRLPSVPCRVPSPCPCKASKRTRMPRKVSRNPHDSERAIMNSIAPSYEPSGYDASAAPVRRSGSTARRSVGCRGAVRMPTAQIAPGSTDLGRPPGDVV
jgi:hypothetical protein